MMSQNSIKLTLQAIITSTQNCSHTIISGNDDIENISSSKVERVTLSEGDNEIKKEKKLISSQASQISIVSPIIFWKDL